jgi:L-threonylcarbamoyladenylate synthase
MAGTLKISIMDSESQKMMNVRPTGTPDLFQKAVAEAARLLKTGCIVGLPTETVYGLAANALDPLAVAHIYEVKGRPAHNPIIVHVASLEMARQFVATWPPLAEKLAKAFWPGPLTLVLPKTSIIPDIVTANGPTVGIRWPSHPVIQAVIQACGFPLAAPSANTSNRISPTTARHVWEDLGDKIPLILDGGPCQIGIESTVLDLSQTPPRLLRPGMIHAEAIAAVTGQLSLDPNPGTGQLRSPGMLKKHYAPKAKLIVTNWDNAEELGEIIQGFAPNYDNIHLLAFNTVPPNIPVDRIGVMPREPLAFARCLYSELHRCDTQNAGLILMETPPKTPPWRAIHDRLKRAAA